MDEDSTGILYTELARAWGSIPLVNQLTMEVWRSDPVLDTKKGKKIGRILPVHELTSLENCFKPREASQPILRLTWSFLTLIGWRKWNRRQIKERNKNEQPPERSYCPKVSFQWGKCGEGSLYLDPTDTTLTWTALTLSTHRGGDSHRPLHPQKWRQKTYITRQLLLTRAGGSNLCTQSEEQCLHQEHSNAEKSTLGENCQVGQQMLMYCDRSNALVGHLQNRNHSYLK